MKILLVNDDGIYGKGILTLADALKDKHEITIVAPHRQMSGTGHSLTFGDYINYTPLDICAGVSAYAVAGTPSDCVKFGIDYLCREKPDAVISGINDGYNLGTDVIYSGTVNAAIEGGLMGVKSIAVSQEWSCPEFERSARFVRDRLEWLLDLLPDNSSVLSVNIPVSCGEPKGIRACEIGVQMYEDKYTDCGIRGFYLNGVPLRHEANAADSDVESVHAGYITVSPIKTDYNDYALLQKLRAAGL